MPIASCDFRHISRSGPKAVVGYQSAIGFPPISPMSEISASDTGRSTIEPHLASQEYFVETGIARSQASSAFRYDLPQTPHERPSRTVAVFKSTAAFQYEISAPQWHKKTSDHTVYSIV